MAISTAGLDRELGVRQGGQLDHRRTGKNQHGTNRGNPIHALPTWFGPGSRTATGKEHSPCCHHG